MLASASERERIDRRIRVLEGEYGERPDGMGYRAFGRIDTDVYERDVYAVAQADESDVGVDGLDLDAVAWWEARYDHQHGLDRDNEYHSGWKRLGRPSGPSHVLKPRLGMGATLVCGNDRYPYTVVGIESDTRIVVRRCHFDTLEELPSTPEDSHVRVLTYRHDRRWREKCSDAPFILGTREAYQPPEV
jgi:hypothetical protein